jgi:hypothetical protein
MTEPHNGGVCGHPVGRNAASSTGECDRSPINIGTPPDGLDEVGVIEGNFEAMSLRRLAQEIVGAP